MTEKEYGKLVKEMAPRSPIVKNCINAFWVGGLICTLGQILANFYCYRGMEQADAYGAASMTLVVFSVLLTGFSVYDDIAQIGGAGTLVPITGFANAVSAPAIEYKTEGYILGIGGNMFKIAGPVIVYGTAASVVYGLIYWVTMR